MVNTQHADPRPAGPVGWWCGLLLASPPTQQKNVHELITPSLNNYYKTCHCLPQVGTLGFVGLAHCVPLCLAKQYSYPFLLHPEFCVQDLLQHQSTEKLSFQHQKEQWRWYPRSLRTEEPKSASKQSLQSTQAQFETSSWNREEFCTLQNQGSCESWRCWPHILQSPNQADLKNRQGFIWTPESEEELQGAEQTRSREGTGDKEAEGQTRRG